MLTLTYCCPSHIGRCLLVFQLMIYIQISSTMPDDYFAKRDYIVNMEAKLNLGGNITLTTQEKMVNDIIMKEKQQLIETSRLNGLDYPPSQSFYIWKDKMADSKIMKIIRRMPKGAALHLHDLSTASIDWLVRNVTYRDNLHMCVDSEYFIIFKFFRNAPQNPDCPWMLVQDARAVAPNVREFDDHLKKNISFLTYDPVKIYADDSQAWKRFNKYFAQIIDMVFYAPVFKDYIYQSLVEFRADNVQYLEFRAQLFGLFDLDGNSYDAEYGLKLYKTAVEQFVRDHPDFSGAKVIMSGLRFKPKEGILKEVQVALELVSCYPDFFLGYDLVGEEPNQYPLLYYLDALLYPSRQHPPQHLPYFFHAGETMWQGTPADKNLIDAVLLNTTRIGHAYALGKHPYVARLIKERDIAVEVNPISNQVLGLVKDLRNHPMAEFLASDFPLVISSDDPATWEALPLSHDWYAAFMALSGETADLSFLKQLAINSLRYSVMTDTERQRAEALWTSKWDVFIKEVLASDL